MTILDAGTVTRFYKKEKTKKWKMGSFFLEEEFFGGMLKQESKESVYLINVHFNVMVT